MLYRIRTYLQFLWNSKNEHGVHSPFVFQLVTQCFYDKIKLNPYFPNLETKTKKGNFLNRLFHYFQFQDGIYISENKKTPPSKVDFIFIDIASLIKNNIELDQIIALANNETCIIFENPHFSKISDRQWKMMVSNPNVNVTIDVYLFGFVFIRNQQEKEHFVIRV